MNKAYAIILAAFFAAVAAPASTQPTEEMRTVLLQENARELTEQCSRISPGPVEDIWAPTLNDVMSIEADLLELVDQQLKANAPDSDLIVQNYYRQYAGFVIDGRKIIYVNGVYKNPMEQPDTLLDWRHRAIKICDGGLITFGVEYDISSRQFSNFSFNGFF